jgi:RimJ/RimL family protein N-acetyltransferase
MQSGVQRLGRAQERAALAFLARAPFDNVFLSWLIHADRSSSTRSAMYVYVEGEQVRGVAFFGRQVVLAAENDAAIAAFAQTAPVYRFERMIVGPRPTVERYWELVRAWHTPPRLIRESQPLLAVERQTLRGTLNGVTVRRARPAEWQSVAHNSAKMIEHELAYDPRSVASEFNDNVRMMIERGLWWVGEREDKLVFFCNAGPRSEQTLQLQGIWTPPAMRGHGYASAALYGICDALLHDVPSLSLYVNGFNAPALALYDRVGFRRVGEFATLLF